MDGSPVTAYQVGGVRAEDLARRFGTPLYVYDAEKIRERFSAFEGEIAHRPLSVFYSIKAHPSVPLLELLRALGAGVDACSPGDLAFAAAAGFTGAEITYTGYSMSDRELEQVVAAGCFLIADSLDQVERMAKLDPGRQIGLRVNFGIARGFHPHVQFGARDSKFGIQDVELGRAIEFATAHGLRVTGLHSHAGSDLLDAQDHLDLLEALIGAASTTPGLRDTLELIDLGGGWGTPFLEDVDTDYPMAVFGKQATERMADLARIVHRPVELRLEPGAYVVMDAGVLLTTVNEIKPSVMVHGERTPAFVGTNTSYNHVHSAVAYGTHHRIVVAGRPDAPATEMYHVTGNLMQAGDVLARDRALPPVKVGDVLAIEKCGGYKACRAPTFNERPRPAEVMVDGGSVRTLRAPELVSDLLRGQSVGSSDYSWTDGVKWSETPFNSELGKFRLVAFEFPDGREHLALVAGKPSEVDLPLVRVQSSCLTGTGFLAQLCDCRQQLQLAMSLIAGEPGGCLLYLDQEGRSHGLVEKVAQLRLIADGLDTVEAADVRGRGPDLRDYGQAGWMLEHLLGSPPIRLLTNSPEKEAGLRASGVSIAEVVSLETPPTPGNVGYLRVKRDRMGHRLSLEDAPAPPVA